MLVSTATRTYPPALLQWINLSRTAVSDCKLAMLDAAGFHNLAQRFMRRSEGALKIVQYANLLLDAVVNMLQVIGHKK